jgi:molybdopterin converting factor small subunit
MNVHIRFFGATADETGCRSIDLAFDENVNAKVVFNHVLDQFPQLKNHRLLFAVNQEYVAGAHLLRSGDELAIFTAVSGG